MDHINRILCQMFDRNSISFLKYSAVKLRGYKFACILAQYIYTEYMNQNSNFNWGVWIKLASNPQTCKAQVQVTRRSVSHGPLRVRVEAPAIKKLAGTSTGNPRVNSCHCLSSTYLRLRGTFIEDSDTSFPFAFVSALPSVFLSLNS